MLDKEDTATQRKIQTELDHKIDQYLQHRQKLL